MIVSLLAACGGDDPMTRHEVCERLAAVTCERTAVCEPTVAKDGCVTAAMNRCCPDGVCDEAVVADAERMTACEAAVGAMSCSDLDDGDLPGSCADLTAPLPDQDTDEGSGIGSGSGSGSDQMEDSVLEVSWYFLAGGRELSCSEFGAAKVRIVATTPAGAKTTKDFPCEEMSGLTTLPSGAYSVVAQALGSGGSVVQQTSAQTVTVYGGASVGFSFSTTTSFGQYCIQLATAHCSACESTNAACEQEMVNDCCVDGGTCNNAAVAKPAWSTCVAQAGTSTYCSALPPSCNGAIQVY